jgi:hypothetical protein
MNAKIQKAAREMGNQIVHKFPDITVIGLEANITDPAGACLRIQFPKDEDREWEVRKFAAQVSNRILEKHHVSILPISGSMPVTNGRH